MRGEGGAARDRRRPDDVPVPHAVGRQELRRPGDGAARGAAAARHGDGAVPSDRTARRPAHAHDRHGARGRPARRRRLSAERRRRALHGSATIRAASARRATSSRARSIAEMRAGRTHAERRRLCCRWAHLGADNRAAAVQGHGRALRRLRLRSRRRPGRGRADRALHDGRRRVRGRLHDGAARPLRRRRGHGRRARRQPARRQRRRQLDGVRRHRRRRDGGVGRAQGRVARARRRRDRGARSRAPRRRFGPGQQARRARRDPRASVRPRCGTTSASCATRRASTRADATLGGARRRARRDALPPGPRPRVQPDVARLAQPRQPGRGQPRDRRRRRGARESRGAHFRADHPGTGDLAASTYIRVRRQQGNLAVEAVPVRFTRVRPGESLLSTPG